MDKWQQQHRQVSKASADRALMLREAEIAERKRICAEHVAARRKAHIIAARQAAKGKA